MPRRSTPPIGLRAARLTDERGPLVVFSFEAPRTPLAILSRAEREVIELLLAGLGTEQIAALRGRSRKTIGNQIESAYRKLGVSSRGELAAKLG